MEERTEWAGRDRRWHAMKFEEITACHRRPTSNCKEKVLIVSNGKQAAENVTTHCLHSKFLKYKHMNDLFRIAVFIYSEHLPTSL